MMSQPSTLPLRPTEIPEPPISRFFFSDTRMAWLWLIVRLYVGWEWLQSNLASAGLAERRVDRAGPLGAAAAGHALEAGAGDSACDHG
jgi:thiosulfate dehydrogenase [quinone] large subunit